jgi:hypothetical protein
VPRQEDVGIDFFCSHITGEGQLLKAGPLFAVQAKSSADPIIYEKPYEIEWITNQENPLLICVADRKALSMDVYSTWNLTCAVLNGWRGEKKPSRILLRPMKEHSAWPWVEDNDDGSQEIWLGKPIARVTDADVYDDSRMQRIADTIGRWIAIDRANIFSRHANLDWVSAPLAYETNVPPDLFSTVGVAFYVHPANLSKYTTNLGRVATTLEFVIRNPQSGFDTSNPPWPARILAIEDLLRSHWDLLDESAKKFLASKGIKPSGC